MCSCFDCYLVTVWGSGLCHFVVIAFWNDYISSSRSLQRFVNMAKASVTSSIGYLGKGHGSDATAARFDCYNIPTSRNNTHQSVYLQKLLVVAYRIWGKPVCHCWLHGFWPGFLLGPASRWCDVSYVFIPLIGIRIDTCLHM